MNIDFAILMQLFAVIAAWFIAQIIKIFLGFSSFSRKDFFSKSGGMPSSHTASASAFFFFELLKNGLNSISALSLVLLVVIIVDATGVRYATGVNASVLKSSLKDKKLASQILLKNGHTKLEVFVGLLVGLIVAWVFILLL